MSRSVRATSHGRDFAKTKNKGITKTTDINYTGSQSTAGYSTKCPTMHTTHLNTLRTLNALFIFDSINPATSPDRLLMIFALCSIAFSPLHSQLAALPSHSCEPSLKSGDGTCARFLSAYELSRRGPPRLSAFVGGRLWRKEGWAFDEEGKSLGEPVCAMICGIGLCAINFALNDFRCSITSIASNGIRQ